MARAVQISAPISKETKDLLEKHSKATGVKKGHLIEAALRYHLRALQELPADVVIPPRVVLSRRSFDELIKRLKSPGEPTAALQDLMRGGD
jgi:uncharacterized protein (DUF1778 family)